MAEEDERTDDGDAPADDELVSIFRGLPDRFRTGVVDRTITFGFDLGEAETERWTVTVDGADCEVERRLDPDACDALLEANRDLFIRMVREDYRPGILDFVRGRVRTTDVPLMKTFRAIFD